MWQSLRSNTSRHVLRLRQAPVTGLAFALTLLVGACENAASFDETAHVAMTIEAKPSPLEGKGTKYTCGSARDTAAYEKAFTIAIQCRYGDQLFQTSEPVGFTPLGLKLLAKKEYGCFCGPGSGGIDTVPLDGVDKCCKQHDERLWDLCQNLPAREGSLPNIKNEGCDCYTKTPEPKCDQAKKTILFENWDKLDACEKACANDMERARRLRPPSRPPQIDNVGVDRNDACQPGNPPSTGTKENPVFYPPEEFKEFKKQKTQEVEPPKPTTPVTPAPTPVPLPRCPNRRIRSYVVGDEPLDETCDSTDGTVPGDVVLEATGGTSGVSLDY